MQRNVQLWLKGLLAAVIGAASNAGTNMLADPDHFNLSKGGLILLGKTAAISALVATFMYLKQSPVPPTVDPIQQRLDDISKGDSNAKP